MGGMKARKPPKEPSGGTSEGALKPLTPSQIRFCQEYLVDLNQTQAYLRAYPEAKPASAKVQAARLLTKPNVKAEVSRLQLEREERTQFTADSVLLALKRVIDMDPADAFQDGRMLQPHEMPQRFRRALAGFEYEERYLPGRTPEMLQLKEYEGAELSLAERAEYEPVGRTMKLKFPDRVPALSLAMKHFGLAKEQVKVEAGEDLLTLLERMHSADESAKTPEKPAEPAKH
jgi:hypothetical protein